VEPWPACNQSVTEGPWGPAVNWVKAQRDMSANMTQYRVNARNCEAKRLHTRPNVASEFAHAVLPDRQIVYGAPSPRRPQRAFGATLEARSSANAARHAAPCSHKLGSDGPTMANCGRIPMSVRRRLAMGLSGVFWPTIDTHPFFSHKESR
jgi:hypothetical protein